MRRRLHDDGLGYTVEVHPLRSIEKEQEQFAGIIGDLASNARAALDHAIYEVARLDTADWEPDRREKALGFAQFPIFSDPRMYVGKNGNGPGVIGMLSEPHRAFIRTLQPFAAELAKALANLHSINNQDKHRVVHVVGFVPTNFGTDFAPPDPPRGLTIDIRSIGTGVVGEGGAPLLFVRFDRRIPNLDVAMQGRAWKLSRFDNTTQSVADQVVGLICSDILNSVDWALDKVEGEFRACLRPHSRRVRT
jgi:hypothetical protein